MTLQISPELAPHSLLSPKLFSECDQLMTSSFSGVDNPNLLKKEVCQLLSSQTLKFNEIINAFFREIYSTLATITLGFCGEKTSLSKQAVALGNNVKLGGYPLMDILACLKPKNPSVGILTTAINSNDLKAAASLLGHGADINERDAQGNTPLHAAAVNSEIGAKAVDLLMERGSFHSKVTGNIASVDAVNRNGDTPLFLALKKEEIPLEVIRSLLNHGAKVNAQKELKSCSTFPAQYTEQLGFDPFAVPVKIRVQKPSPDPICTYHKEHAKTPLDFAVGRENPDINTIRLLLERGASPNLDMLRVKIPENLREDIITLALEHGANSNRLLSVAVREGFSENIITRLLEYGANPTEELECQVSQREPNMRTITLLLNSWAGLSAEERKSSSLLTDCCDFGVSPALLIKDKVKVIKFLLENGADPHKQDVYGQTAFSLYASFPINKEPYLEGLKLFVNHGVDLNAIFDGKTPLDSISQGGDMHEAVAYLKSKGALTLKELSSKKSIKDEL